MDKGVILDIAIRIKDFKARCKKAVPQFRMGGQNGYQQVCLGDWVLLGSLGLCSKQAGGCEPQQVCQGHPGCGCFQSAMSSGSSTRPRSWQLGRRPASCSGTCPSVFGVCRICGILLSVLPSLPYFQAGFRALLEFGKGSPYMGTLFTATHPISSLALLLSKMYYWNLYVLVFLKLYYFCYALGNLVIFRSLCSPTFYISF